MKITLDLTDETIHCLARLEPKVDAPAEVAAAVALINVSLALATGVRRPGSWERQVVNQLFGDDWTEDPA